MSPYLSALLYLATALACLAAAGWASVRLRRSPLRGRWMLALGGHALWSAVLAWWVASGRLSPALLLAAEVCRYLLWSLVLARLPVLARSQLTLRVMPAACAIGLILVVMPQVWPAGPVGGLRSLSIGALLLACSGLAVIEQVVRYAEPSAARALKFCAIGIGGQFVFDLILYSQAAVFTGLADDTLHIRGAVHLLLLPFVVLGFGQLGSTRAAVYVSRDVVFYTTAALAVGAYLVLMALGGYYVSLFGGTWGTWLQFVFLAGAGIALAAILLSGSGWRRLRVWIATHFYRNKYDYRAEWLRFIATLSGAGHDARQLAIRSVAQILDCPGGVLYLRGPDAGGFDAVAAWGDVRQPLAVMPSLGSEAELVRVLDGKDWVIDVDELRDSRSANPVQLPPWLAASGSGWRIVSPLRGPQGLLGFLLLRTPRAPFRMTYEDRDLLKTVGRQVAGLLIQQETNARLAESRQFEAFSRLASFMMHDLKNSVAQLQLIVNNAARHRHNPEFMDDAIDTIANTVSRMTRLIEQLQARNTDLAPRELELGQVAREAARRSGVREPPALLQEPPPSCAVRGDPERVAAMLDHVIRNAQEAAGPEGRVALRVVAEGESALVEIEDDGPGMDPEFVRERLFKPFDSTKGVKGMGIGAYQVREYAREMGGQVEVRTSPGRGTTFRITLPLCRSRSQPS